MKRYLWIIILICDFWLPLKGQQIGDHLAFSASEGCSLEELITSEHALYAVIRYRGAFDFPQVQVPVANHDRLILISLSADGQSVNWYMTAKSADNTESVQLIFDPELNRLYWSGMFWNSFELDDETNPLSVGSRGIFYTAVDGSSGEVMWTKILQGSGIKQSSSLAYIPGDKHLITGFFSQDLTIDDTQIMAPSGNFMFAAIFNPDGTLEVVRHFGWTGDIRPRVSEGTSRGFIIAGTIRGTIYFDRDTLTGGIPDDDLFIIRLMPDGTNPWARIAGGAYDKVVNSMEIVDDQILLAGYFMGQFFFRQGLLIQTNGLNFDAFVAEYDWEGFPSKAVRYFGPGNIYPNGITYTDKGYLLSGIWEGGLLVDGQMIHAPIGTRHGFFIRMDHDLQLNEFSQVISAGILSDVQYYKSEDSEYITLNHQQQIQFADQQFDTNGNFQGLLLLMDVLSGRVDVVAYHPEIKIWPNPFKNQLFTDKAMGADYIMVDMQGRWIAGGRVVEVINLPHLLPGMYRLIIYKEGQYLWSEVIVKI